MSKPLIIVLMIALVFLTTQDCFGEDCAFRENLTPPSEIQPTVLEVAGVIDK